MTWVIETYLRPARPSREEHWRFSEYNEERNDDTSLASALAVGRLAMQDSARTSANRSYRVRNIETKQIVML